MASNDRELDDILDEALNDFDDEEPVPVKKSPAAPSPSSNIFPSPSSTSSTKSPFQFAQQPFASSFSQAEDLLNVEQVNIGFTNNNNKKQKGPAEASTSSSNASASASSTLPQMPLDPADVDLDKIYESMGEEEKKLMQDFAKEMDKFFGDLETNKSGTPSGASAAGSVPFASSASGSSSSSNEEASNLRSSIEQTLKNLAQSTKQSQHMDENLMGDGSMEEQAKNLMSMLEQFNLGEGAEGGAPAGGEGGEEDEKMYSFLEQIMSTLMSPDVLKGPMQQLKEKYPAYLEKHKNTMTSEEYSRIAQQYEYTCKICSIYDNQKFPDCLPQLIDLMKGMQALGQPPDEIVNELNVEGGGKLPTLPDPSKCPVQ